jgi:Uma2 family endonuclease
MPNLVTVAEFEPMQAQLENRDRLLELIDGRISEKMPTEQHGVIVGELVRHLGNHIEAFDIEGVVGVEIRHQLPFDVRNSRLPDASFRYVSLQDLVTYGAVPQMPDLAIEVASPNDTLADMMQRAEYYLKNGTRLVWLLFPNSKTIVTCVWRNQQLVMTTLTQQDVLTGDEVLPHFRLPIQKIFRF